MLIVNSLYLDLVRYVLVLCCFIPMWVFVVLGWQLLDSQVPLSLEDENNPVELAWTVIPTFAVLGLCYFNLRCLGYDYFTPAKYVAKIVGHQWYWSYDVPCPCGGGSYDSFMSDFINSVDKPLRLYSLCPYSLLVTSADVIHSFSLPSFSFKVDAVPGRINQVSFMADRVGVFVGYCSELCGAGHAYMPIVVEVVNCKLR
uniref:cytochrome-c oxidase n=1 Tax=Eurytrema pancreaticum TaxID=374591 RepID=A0A0E3Y6M4_EUTPN|nr:cytochrome c oxidase subunit 2 [Eurytrema pancreaticum]